MLSSPVCSPQFHGGKGVIEEQQNSEAEFYTDTYNRSPPSYKSTSIPSVIATGIIGNTHAGRATFSIIPEM